VQLLLKKKQKQKQNKQRKKKHRKKSLVPFHEKLERNRNKPRNYKTVPKSALLS